MKNEIVVYDTKSIFDMNYRIHEIEYGIADRFFNLPIEQGKLRRILNKNIDILKHHGPLFSEYYHLHKKLTSLRKIALQISQSAEFRQRRTM